MTKEKSLKPDAQPGDSAGNVNVTSLNPRPSTPPPPYQPEENFPNALNETLAKLKFDARTHKPSADECIAHLKFLEALYLLREDVAGRDGVFDIVPPAERGRDEKEQAAFLARVREKRWAVYVARAVDRFEAWWGKCVPQTTGGVDRGCLTSSELLTNKELHLSAGEMGMALAFPSAGNMPPLDVLMVWHAYTLNPRAYFEDCLRYGKLDFWASAFPWRLVNDCVDTATFEYAVSPRAKEQWEKATGHRWDNLMDPMEKTLRCPLCPQAHYLSIPWCRQAGFVEKGSVEFYPGTGFADKDFEHYCDQAGSTLNHDMLRVLKFRGDVQNLITKDIPVSGTILDHEGKPPLIPARARTPPPCYYPSGIIKAGLYVKIIEATDPSTGLRNTTMDTIKRIFEKYADKKLVHRYKGSSFIAPPEKRALRRMMSRYWYNSSPFALDLVGAVIRQGTFIEKMHRIDWLHSPSVRATMDRLITKYVRFFNIIAENPTKLAVPTLDVDLAWHTHQTRPQSYFSNSDHLTSKLIDHDDKIEENMLDTAFEWTSKTYQKAYGEAYSECTCWYCEAIRESHTSPLSRLFKTNNHLATASLHTSSSPHHQKNPSNNDALPSPHISAHPAIRTPDSTARSEIRRAQIDKSYNAACRRAVKEGREPPPRDSTFNAWAWGYYAGSPDPWFPYPVAPAYIGGDCYVVDPGYCETAAGAYGSLRGGVGVRVVLEGVVAVVLVGVAVVVVVAVVEALVEEEAVAAVVVAAGVDVV
ncbi:hypothetical protein K490DRAFT_55237 [Saccharata proteae CBS 121410]|uniref:Alpha-ketoglutarate-dependent sulfonate dioxygenase n=1 Tax=Saccharata proteae CBS 121410 TaxID=1314787 RepID=A0A6A5YDQ8_9PEZI|nr:hypothetical protein K490DRAFT_55237 [Saccharata proteae CBS 121410]